MNLTCRPNGISTSISRAQTAVERASGSGEEKDARELYRWSRTYSPPATPPPDPDSPSKPDLSFSTLSWERLSVRLAETLDPEAKPREETRTEEAPAPESVPSEVRRKAASLTLNSKTSLDRLKAIYGFVSTQIVSVDLPLAATGFRVRQAEDVLRSGYGTAEDKFALFAALAAAVHLQANAALTGSCDKTRAAIPSDFKQLLVVTRLAQQSLLARSKSGGSAFRDGFFGKQDVCAVPRQTPVRHKLPWAGVGRGPKTPPV